MPNPQITQYLSQHHIHYDTIKHDAAFTAQEAAARAHVSGKEMAKTVMVKIDGKLAMVLMPANIYVNLQLLQDETGSAEVTLATEADFRALFPDCELGAMPPFSELYDVDIYASRRLSEDKKITFNAGNHSELIRLNWQTFFELVKPTMLDL